MAHPLLTIPNAFRSSWFTLMIGEFGWQCRHPKPVKARTTPHPNRVRGGSGLNKAQTLGDSTVSVDQQLD